MIVKLKSNRVRRTYLGGGRIDAFTGAAADYSDGMPRPEDWTASTTTAYNGTLEIAGEGQGMTEGGRFVRDAVGDLPILVKLLDSDERLVIQAHPTVAFARTRMNSPVGKTECWYFLPGTASDACVYLGFKSGISRERWQAAFAEQKGLLDCLHRIPVQAGDFVFVDGGVPHAIGAGCFMIELQEPSDLMVVAERATPNGRRIPDGKIFGGLDLEGMLDVYDYCGRSFEETCARYVRRAVQFAEADREFKIVGSELTDKFEMWLLKDRGRIDLDGVGAVAVVIEGEGLFNGTPVRAGDRLALKGERQVSCDGECRIVTCFKRREG